MKVKVDSRRGFELDRQYGWIWDEAFIIHDILENRTMVQCIVSVVERLSIYTSLHLYLSPSIPLSIYTSLHLYLSPSIPLYLLPH
jgi:hypothetical protein